MFCLAQLEVYHLLLILKMGEAAVAVLRKASSIMVRPRGFIEELISIIIVIGLLSKLPDARHCCSCKA